MNVRHVLLLAGGLASTPALADPITLKPIVDARIRYEHVDQDAVARNADAVTARIRAGAEAARGDFTVLVEGEGILAINGNYNSGVNGKTAFPIVPDPQTIGLNRAQIQYRGLPKTVVTVGRQRINLDDQRFVGSVAWRDNEQTFDAARIVWSAIPHLKADVAYAWSNRTIWGIDGGNRFGPARYESIDGTNILANLALTTKVGTLTAFTYLVDQNEALVLRNSSQTYGARFVGAYAFTPKTKFGYMLSYARQSNYRNNPNRNSADYYVADVTLDLAALRIGGGYEVLGADDGVAVTSFQTPLATLHKFNGWADKFLVTPPDGLTDAYGSIGYGWKKAGPFDAVALTAVYHRFRSDRSDRHYGDELNVQATFKRGRTSALIKYADYKADSYATDTRKLWLSLEWTI